MADINKVKIQNFVEEQIPEFINQDNPLFKEFLEQYYSSLEHTTGTIDLARNLNEYKSIDFYNRENFYSENAESCKLTSDLQAFDTTINVNHTIGFPSKYGLLKINGEIITYLRKTDTTFEECVRGFSGIDEILDSKYLDLIFKQTSAEFHSSESTVDNLNIRFFNEFFRKFKYQFVPGFEDREFAKNLNIQSLLLRIKDFYRAKGTKESYEILFKILYNSDIDIITPQEYMLRPSDNKYFITTNILVEKIFGEISPLELKGRTIFQRTSKGLASGEIYNVEFRPVDDKILYEISLDPEKSILEFISTKKTYILDKTNKNSNSIIVDSTVGFPNSGELLITSENLPSPFKIKYQDKTINQFLKVSGIQVDLSQNDVIIEPNFAYVNLDDEIVEFRVINVINDVDISNTSNLRVSDIISLSSFGANLSSSKKFTEWVYNIPTTHKIKNISSTSDPNTWRIELFDGVKFTVDEKINLITTDSTQLESTVKDVINNTTILVTSQRNITNVIELSKLIVKATSQNYSEINSSASNIQNTYIDEKEEFMYVASSGLPDYTIFANDRRVLVSTPPLTGTGNSSGITTTVLNTNIVHWLYTGEKVYFTPSQDVGISSGIYYVSTSGSSSNENLSLAYSDSDLFLGNYINLPFGLNGTIVKIDYQNIKLNNQKLLKKIPLSEYIDKDSTTKNTNNKTIGILANGVELFATTLFDENIYYGKLDNIQITNRGKDYDVINPPDLVIEDELGEGAIGHLNVTGALKEVRILDPGYGYDKDIRISIAGGNGSGSELVPNIIRENITAPFIGNFEGVDPNEDTIRFIKPHNFEDGELIQYLPSNNDEIDYYDPISEESKKLPENSVYYAGVISDTEIKLYSTEEDAINKVNEIDLIISNSFGIHHFRTIESKNVLSGIYIESPGSGYSNKKVIISAIENNNDAVNGINLFDNYIFATNHNFNDKDLIIYSDSTDEPISNLTIGSKYYVKVIDENKFKLAFAGTDEVSDENFVKNKYINFDNIGSGNHTFSYPPIEIIISAYSETSVSKFKLPTLEPIITGSIESVFLEANGVNYGVNNIINYHRRPNIGIMNIASEAILRPTILDGRIVNVQILSQGRGYSKDIDIIVDGNGKFASLYPTIQNGRIVSINIINSGIGYDQNTIIRLKKRGTDATFLGNIYEWKINQVAKNLPILTGEDEGILVPSLKEEPDLQFVHFYPPKVLRRKLKDNIVSGDKEHPTPTESPILGWSYDGYPIYGPYSSVGGVIKNITSGYELILERNRELRPPTSIYPAGFFIQDYEYNSSNEDGLDEYNGKYIKNTDFPEGTYAYFYTIDISEDGISSPQYPYVIGKEFKSYPQKENYDPNHNQNLDLNELGLIRNTAPYYLNSTNSYYKSIDLVDSKYKQEFIVDNISSSEITGINLYTNGDGYRVGELLRFDNSDTSGSGANGSISAIDGKSITTINLAETKYDNISFYKKGIEIVGVSTTPIDIKTNDFITISNIDTISHKSLERKVKVNTYGRVVELLEDIGPTSQTGIITSILPNDVIGFEVDDFIKIDNEIAKILQIFPNKNKLVVQRLSNTESHTAGESSIELLPRKFTFFDRDNTLDYIENTTTYFNPSDVVSFGISQTQYTIDGDVEISIPERSIYIPNHKYTTNQPVIYNSGFGGTPLIVSNSVDGPYFQLSNGQTVYVVNNGSNYIGLTTGIGTSFNPLYFTYNEFGFGKVHSLRTTFDEVFGSIEKYSVVITTKEPHQLVSGDIIQLNLIPEITNTIKFRYEDSLKKITTEKINFEASEVDLNESNITIISDDIKTGDKVIYYSNGEPEIGGLVDSSTYFVINTTKNRIKLAQYYSDAIDGKYITLTSTSSGPHSFAKINPRISITSGNSIIFDVTDDSLTQTYLKLYSDKEFKNELESYRYKLVNGMVIVGNELLKNNKEIYYTFISSDKIITVDNEVIENNTIEISTSDYNNEYLVNAIDDKSFEFELRGKPENIEYTRSILSRLEYSTNSNNVSGPISSIKLNYGGSGYKKLPKVDIISETGKGAILKATTNKIGRISALDRVKDGFDYPSDTTLLPVLSVPAVIQIEDISRVDYVGIITSGRNYNVAPSLKVIGNSRIKLEAILDGSSVVDVKIIENTNDLSESLRVVPTRNSNGYSIDEIIVNGSDVTIELLNSDVDRYPLIAESYGDTESVFPFEVGDQIFIERCRISSTERDSNNEIIIKDNFNSSGYGYTFFTITGVSTENYTITYSMQGVKDELNLGEYSPEFGYGYVVNRRDMAEFEMFISNDLSYTSEELVLGYDANGVNTFSAKVLKNGWDNIINELRLIDVKGNIKVGDKLEGQISRLRGTVTSVDVFNLRTKLGVSRSKLNDLGDRIGFLNDYYQRISDNNYYQKFSYSIKGEIPYSTWKEPVGSIIHPSGFKEFSDLVIFNKAQDKLRTSTKSTLDLTINIDNVQSFYTKNNFGSVTEEEQFEDGSIERVIFGEGVILKPYLELRSNKVIEIDSISSEFDGTAILEVIANKSVTFISTDLYKLGVSTEGLNIGDKIGVSTYHFYPDSTYIFDIGDGYIELSPDTPHRLNSSGGEVVTISENLDFYRRVPGSKVVGRTEFDLKNKGIPLFFREFNSSDENLINKSIFNIPNHNFQTGQQLEYDSNEQSIVAVAVTSIGSGAILIPVFTQDYSISKIKILSGGSGYSNVAPPNIEIINTEVPILDGEFDVVVDSDTGAITDISIVNSGFGYYPLQSNCIGIITSTEVEVRTDIIMEVGGATDSAIYENGYNVAISTNIIGQSANIEPDFSGNQTILWGATSPFIPAKESFNGGFDAKFSVFITYNSSTGQPISTSIILRDGGRGYSVGDTVSIAGTYLGGDTPDNDLSFVVSKVSNTRIGLEQNKIYTDIPASTLVGYGTGAIFNVFRGEFGEIAKVEVISGGDNYSIGDNISIAGTYIGGVTPTDNLLLSPTVLGTDKLPNKLYVKKLNINEFQVFGTPTGSPLILTSPGIGTHTIELVDQNVNSMITIDNIIQTPLHRKSIEFTLQSPIKYNDTIISMTEDVYKLKLNDILKVNDEILIVKNTRVDGDNSVLVQRAAMGTERDVHDELTLVYVLGGNYNISKDKLHFITAPYGPTGLPGLEVGSSFSGRAFSRRFDPYYKNNENLILDDISEEFVGSGTTEFILKSNGASVVGLYTNTNSILGTTSGEDISNSPIILINNIPQIGEVDYTIDTPSENKLKFLSGTPISGKIITVSVLNKGFGYLPLVGASATVSVSSSGEIDNVYLNGAGSGYRVAPEITILSNEGVGAQLEATIDTNGSIDSISIVSSGSGYSTTILPEVRIDEPQNYYNLDLVYANGSSGDGEGAKASLVISNDSSVKTFILETPGRGYRVGDVLVSSGIMTNPQASSFEEFEVVVDEIFTDSITGWYPGQFVQFNDISRRFNGFRRRFNISAQISGKSEIISLKALDPTDIQVENNLFVFINDILQVPYDSYTFSGSRIIFKEAPKADSKCNIVFFRGSDLDVDLIEPLITIKEGDSIKIDANRFNPFDIPQFERVVNNIVSIDTLDTFPYEGIGITTDQNRVRPLHWTKQTKDTVINGVLYSKSRSNLNSRITPIANVIKDISISDEQIYVDSAIPLFEDIDQTRGVGEENRNIVIIDNYDDFIHPELKATVGYAGSISSIDIVNPGAGYKLNINPIISISTKNIIRKDPLFKWSSISGISTNVNFISIGYGNQFIALGSSGDVYFSSNGKDWRFNTVIDEDVEFSHILGISNDYIAVGSDSVYKSFGTLNTNWQKIELVDDNTTVGVQILVPSNYNQRLTKCAYNQIKNKLLVVGEGGAVFVGTGPAPDVMYRYVLNSESLNFNINSIASNSTNFVLVGDLGNIYYSKDEISWVRSNFTTFSNLNDIIWDDNRFIVVGNNGVILISTNGEFWSSVSPTGINGDISSINYSNGIYTILDNNGNLYYSLDLIDWRYRDTLSDSVVDIISTGLENEEIYLLVGSSGTILYSTPTIHPASVVSIISNGQLEELTILDGGFGYSTEEDIVILIEDEYINKENIFSIKAKGDYGIITNVEVYPTGDIGFGTTYPAIEFTLQSSNYTSQILPNMEYSPIQEGDFFIINNSNVECSHPLVGVSTTFGTIGITTTFIDGIYRAEYVSTDSESGISTVRCYFSPISTPFGDAIDVNIGINTTGFYGDYSFGIIYDYQNRAVESPKIFNVNSRDGLAGLNTGPIIYRTRPVK